MCFNITIFMSENIYVINSTCFTFHFSDFLENNGTAKTFHRATNSTATVITWVSYLRSLLKYNYKVSRQTCNYMTWITAILVNSHNSYKICALYSKATDQPFFREGSTSPKTNRKEQRSEKRHHPLKKPKQNKSHFFLVNSF